ncbi:hypothetical protein [uncultured Dokdonia sp.]|uniref:hypothetical protein n=1 Tax=uncultured Dokdonia sp. TaxID=575653 RepID=UPI0026209160|nr:hypothetical protein [uncultured Dokdonia sp.]
MKKVILVVIGCLAYVSVQAQSIASSEQVKKVIDTQLATITSKTNFSETQKTFLKTYVIYTVKSKTKGFRKEALAMNIEDVNMDTFFTEQQRKVIRETLTSISSNKSLFKQPTLQKSSAEGTPKPSF